eukprot:TRINITY_DN75784_c0_g1_i1.p2 TRINITY_DN75784_c0_g1~~TRINITY_DN75784_c0_g1_i1.p2  ORF type:complete len:172 (-),score=28.23 TRINITY_DN75784_c0_g1_i1:567-1082(-)
MDDSQDLYTVLGVSKEASQSDVRKAYLKRALQWHPDKNHKNKDHAEQMFKVLAQAYYVLSHPKRRRDYDRSGLDGLHKGWWPADADSEDMAFQFFKARFPGHAPFAAFSEAKLRAMFPDLYTKKDEAKEEVRSLVWSIFSSAAESEADNLGAPEKPGDDNKTTHEKPRSRL